jgi:RNA polymerase sigma factor (sigma-70 family)
VTRTPVPPFEDFLQANRGVVYRFLSVAVGPNEADDAVQETFLAALRAYPRLEDGSRLGHWILTIASRKAIDHHRATRRRPIPVPEMAEVASQADDPRVGDDPLWTAVAALPPRQRVAVVHRHVLDRPYAEIAEMMGSTEDAARANVYQGTKRLRELMR